jgi:phospholipid-transporting ATPase
MITHRLEEILSELNNKPTNLDAKEQEHALIISGDALLHALKPAISSKVTSIGDLCSVVLCCRVSPKQKQDVVALVRKEVALNDLINAETTCFDVGNRRWCE